MTVGDRIRATREKLGMSQTDLAKKMGYSGKTSIHRVENSGNDVTLKTVSKFANALDVTESYLMGWEDGEIELMDGKAELLAKITMDDEWLECSALYYSFSDEKRKLIRNTINAFRD